MGNNNGPQGTAFAYEPSVEIYPKGTVFKTRPDGTMYAIRPGEPDPESIESLNANYCIDEVRLKYTRAKGRIE